MEEMEEEPPSSPFWLQSSTNRRRRRRLLRSSSLFLNTSFLVLVLLLAAVLFLFVVIPSVLNLIHRTFKPSLVKKSWDSLNLILVLFAIVCGFIGRKDDDQARLSEELTNSENGLRGDREQRTTQATARQWYEESDTRMAYGLSRSDTARKLKRTFSSTPDLRQELNWVSEGEWRRSYDDTFVTDYYQPNPNFDPQPIRSPVDTQQDDSGITKASEADASVNSQQEEALPTNPPAPPTQPSESPPPPVPSQSTAPPPLPSAKVKRKAGQDRRERKRVEFTPVAPAPLPPPPSPPPPPLSPPQTMGEAYWEEKVSTSDKKRGGLTKDFLASIYHQKKRKKKQRQKSYEKLEELPQPHFPPPPPPPPPPPSKFHLFQSKKGRSKKVASVSTPIPPPPPPPPITSTAHSTRPRTKSITISRKPAIKATATSYSYMDENASRGNESPLHPIPPPPPPPPFKMPAWKFIVQGDYVKLVESTNNSPRSGYSESEDGETPTNKEGKNQLFCPSPDVNIKADDFIAKFRAKLKLEKTDSMQNKQGTGLSPLGQESSPSPSPSPSFKAMT